MQTLEMHLIANIDLSLPILKEYTLEIVHIRRYKAPSFPLKAVKVSMEADLLIYV